MQKYGMMEENGNLLLSSKKHEGYKPVVYAKIQHDFDQTTQYIIQSSPIDNGDHIYLGIEVRQLELDEDEDGEYDIF